MVKIRLSRQGKKNFAFYRIVAVDEGKKSSGCALEIIGTWNPTKKSLTFDQAKYDLWVKNGAQVSPSVTKLILKK